MSAEIIQIFDMGKYTYCVKDTGRLLSLIRRNKKSGVTKTLGSIFDGVYVSEVVLVSMHDYTRKEMQNKYNGLSDEYVKLYLDNFLYINGKRLMLFNFSEWKLPFKLKDGNKYRETYKSIVNDLIVQKVHGRLVRLLKQFIEEQINAYEKAGMEF